MSTGIQFSIIVPIYNAGAIEHKFRRCVESIQAQTFCDWELILVNDASTDATADILQSMAVADKRIRILTNKENIRQGMSRDIGAIAAVGDYIIYCDHDDYMFPHLLETASSLISSHDRPEVIQFNFVMVNEDLLDEFISVPRRKISWWKRAFIVRRGDEILNRYLYGRISTNCWARAVRTDLARRIKFGETMPEDMPYSLALCAQATTVIEVRGIGYVQDLRTDAGGNIRQKFLDRINIWGSKVSPLLLAHRVAQRLSGGYRVFCHRWVQHGAFLLDRFSHSNEDILAWGQMADSMNTKLIGGAIYCLWRDMRRGRLISGIKTLVRTRWYYRTYQRLKRVG
ncbi:MAG: glycosyltransferase family 2 protein [Gammaproteobacteria bacterium]|nr:glycosyltransferase family 2 protein [Pseudomonadota bacterium]MCH9663059.1 glycosyltransferase family 2 protein [Gammaproteobacteria bacterium]